MYSLGNELDLEQNLPLLAKVNDYMDWCRNYSIAKWGRSIPFIDAVRDNPSKYDQLYDILECDVFCTNAGYRGPSFWALWDGDGSNSGLGPLSRMYNKPNYIGEIGWHQINGSQTANNTGWVNGLWRELLQKGVLANGCIGGTFFEYMDEPYTKNDIMEKSMGMVSSYVAVEGDPMPQSQFASRGDYTVVATGNNTIPTRSVPMPTRFSSSSATASSPSTSSGITASSSPATAGTSTGQSSGTMSSSSNPTSTVSRTSSSVNNSVTLTSSQPTVDDVSSAPATVVLSFLVMILIIVF